MSLIVHGETGSGMGSAAGNGKRHETFARATIRRYCRPYSGFRALVLVIWILSAFVWAMLLIDRGPQGLGFSLSPIFDRGVTINMRSPLELRGRALLAARRDAGLLFDDYLDVVRVQVFYVICVREYRVGVAVAETSWVDIEVVEVPNPGDVPLEPWEIAVAKAEARQFAASYVPPQLLGTLEAPAAALLDVNGGNVLLVVWTLLLAGVGGCIVLLEIKRPTVLRASGGIAEDSTSCPRCGYEIGTAGRCPECGFGFQDPVPQRDQVS